MKRDRFGNRYFIKLASSLVIIVVNSVIQFLLPRAFSVEDYGYYNYNLNIFVSVLSIANLSTTNAFIAKFSKKNEEIGYVTFYLRFWVIMAAVLNIGLCLLFPFINASFPGQAFFVVLLALESQIVTQFMADSISIFDAVAISRFSAVMQILFRVLLSAFVIGGYAFGRLSIYYFYISQITIGLIIIVFMQTTFYKEHRRLYNNRISRKTAEYIREFYKFCKPLILAGIFGQAVSIFTNWSLMHWSGAASSAMFGVAWQINSMVAFIFSPYAALCKREFSVLIKDENMLRIRFVNGLKIIIWITGYFAIFIGFAAQWILPLIFGSKYGGAGTVTLIVMIYTVYASWGQMKNALLNAYENTKLIAVLSVIGQVVNIACVFLFQIPNLIWPNTLGSIGIALTYLVSVLFSTFLGLYFCARYLNLSFWQVGRIQILPICACSLETIILVRILNQLITGNSTVMLFIKTFIAGVIYTGVTATIIWLKPDLIGLSRERILNLPVLRLLKKRGS